MQGGATPIVARRQDDVNEASALIDGWIEPDPRRRGIADARIREYCVHVWAIVGYVQGVDGDVEHVAKAYEIPVDAVRATQASYERHPQVIEARMDANRA